MEPCEVHYYCTITSDPRTGTALYGPRSLMNQIPEQIVAGVGSTTDGHAYGSIIERDTVMQGYTTDCGHC